MSEQLSPVPSVDPLTSLKESDWAGTRALFTAVRQASDHIRETVIPDLLAKKVSAKEAFYALHAAECGDDPARAAGFPPRYDEDCQNVITRGERIQAGTCRTHWIDASHAWHSAPAALPALERDVFANIDELKPSDEVTFLRNLTLIQASLLIAHFPQDIAGRTTEDFLVYLSQLHGHPVSISQNGYRGVPKVPAIEGIENAQDVLFGDILYSFDQQHVRPRYTSREDLKSNGYIDSVIRSKFLTESQRSEWPEDGGRPTDPMSEAIQDYITHIAHSLSVATADAGLRTHLEEKLPALSTLQRGMTEARHRVYTVFSPETQQVADATMGCLAFTPIAATHWRPDYVPSYSTLINHLQTGIGWLRANGQPDLAAAIAKRADEILGQKTRFS